MTQTDTQPPAARSGIHAGIFLLSLATLMYEILLTRVFSVMMWHHFGFMAVSLAMFGTTAGAVTVFLAPRFFVAQTAPRHMGAASLLFALTAAGSFLVLVHTRFVPEVSWAALDAITFIYAVASIPFLFTGICIALALTRFPARVGSLYAADLAGASLGCLALGAVISTTDAATTAFLVAWLGAAAAVCLAAGRGSPPWLSGLACLGLGALVVFSGVRANRQDPLVRLQWARGNSEPVPLYEKWNSFSRISVVGDSTAASRLHTWGLSPAYGARPVGRQLVLTNDAGGGAFLTAFDGDLAPLQFHRYDIASVVHHLRPATSVLIVGAGGGRDVLAALNFGQPSITAVEINGSVVQAVNGRFGPFTGHLDRQQGVEFVTADARSFVARQPGAYGVLQFSFVDTWAGSAAGAFALSENSLYTMQAWEAFLDGLQPTGLISVTRYYFSDLPAEFYRLFNLATSVLRTRGAVDPARHIVILRHVRPRAHPSAAQNRRWPHYDIGTMLVSPSPLSQQDLLRIEQLASGLDFDIMHSPTGGLDEQFLRLAAGAEPGVLTSAPGVDISPPTDDRPFVNSLLSPGHLLDENLLGRGNLDSNRTALFLLASLLLFVLLLAGSFVVVPLMVSGPRRGAWPHLGYFCAIGAGFMLVEISMMQRLTVFLGHPTYGLSIVLFTLLLSGGVGSLLTQRIGASRLAQLAPPQLLVPVAVLLATGWICQPVMHACAGQATPIRIAAAMALLCPSGILMGMAFPLGMRQAQVQARELTPWLFGVNGAVSVCAAVLAAVVSLVYGISATFWLGVLAYAGATLIYHHTARRTSTGQNT